MRRPRGQCGGANGDAVLAKRGKGCEGSLGVGCVAVFGRVGRDRDLERSLGRHTFGFVVIFVVRGSFRGGEGADGGVVCARCGLYSSILSINVACVIAFITMLLLQNVRKSRKTRVNCSQFMYF